MTRIFLPTGKKNSDTQFVNGASLKGVTLDNGFEFSEADGNRCILSNGRLTLTVEPDKSYPVLQVYTPPHRNSIALENLSGAPDNFNNGMGLVLLPPGEKKVFGTSYVVAVNREA
jgi:aldose 1-epimerase